MRSWPLQKTFQTRFLEAWRLGGSILRGLGVQGLKVCDRGPYRKPSRLDSERLGGSEARFLEAWGLGGWIPRGLGVQGLKVCDRGPYRKPSILDSWRLGGSEPRFLDA